ncbi:MAG: hypothetical protein ACLFR2_05675 [Candidatus Kapaibacterium sp.]
MAQNTNIEKTASDLTALLDKTGGKIAPSDAAAATGYSLDEVKEGLTVLLERYRCRVHADEETGALVFDFKYPLVRRSKKSFKEIALKVADKAWQLFKVVYKAAIGVVLIMYTIVFALILLALLSRSDDRDSGGGFNIVGGIFRAIMEAFMWGAILAPTEYSTGPYGERYRRYKPEKNKGKNFIQSIFHFVLGPDRPEIDPMNDAKEAAAFIRANKGRITAGNIIALTGVDYPEAESRLAEYALKYKGELEIDENGTVVAEFPEMLQGRTRELEGGNIEFYVDEVEPPYEITGNSGGRNAIIALMNVFNLIMAGFLLSFFSVNMDFNVLAFALGWFPLVFSILFFVIPLLRIPVVKANQKKREKNVIRKKLVGTITLYPDEPMSLETIFKRSGIPDELHDKSRAILDDLVIEMQGDVSLNDEGEAVFTFPRLSRELRA